MYLRSYSTTCRPVAKSGGRRASGVTKCMLACKCKESKHVASEARKEN